MFDAQAYVNSLEPPVFIDQGGRRHEGRILGTDDWMRLQISIRLAKLPDGKWDISKLDAAMRAIVRKVFPYTLRDALHFRVSVEYMVWKLPPVARMRAVWDFSVAQARAAGTTAPDLPLGSETTTTMAEPSKFKVDASCPGGGAETTPAAA